MANSFQTGESPSRAPAGSPPDAGIWKPDAGSARTSARSAADAAASAASAAGSDLNETAKTATDALRRQAGQFARDVGDELSRTGESQKERGADVLHRFAGAIDSAANDLEEQSPAVARMVHETARRVGDLSSELSSRNVNELLEQATQLARAKPALFIGGSVAAGFALARFLASSARRGPARTSDRTPD
jgi:hypothetical protein